MPGPWVLAEDLQQTVADILKTDVLQLEPYWKRMVDSAIDSGYRDIKNILLGRNYTMGQLDTWDDRVSYTRQQSLFWLYTETTLGLGMSDIEILKLDHRKYLTDATALAINGQLVPPGATIGNGASVGGGLMDDSTYRINGSTEF